MWRYIFEKYVEVFTQNLIRLIITQCFLWTQLIYENVYQHILILFLYRKWKQMRKKKGKLLLSWVALYSFFSPTWSRPRAVLQLFTIKWHKIWLGLSLSLSHKSGGSLSLTSLFNAGLATCILIFATSRFVVKFLSLNCWHRVMKHVRCKFYSCTRIEFKI